MRKWLIIAACIAAGWSGEARADEIEHVKQLQSQYITAMGSGNLDKALELSNNALKLMPQAPGLWSDNGAILLKMGRKEEALKSLTKAAELGPSSRILSNRAQALSDLKRFKEAVDDSGKAIALDPNNCMAYNNRAIAEMQLGFSDKALADFSKAIELKPDMEVAYRSRGKVKMDLHDLDGAKADLDKAISMDPSDSGAYCTRAALHWTMKDREKALADINYAYKLDPKHQAIQRTKEFMEKNPITVQGAGFLATDDKLFENLTGKQKPLR